MKRADADEIGQEQPPVYIGGEMMIGQWCDINKDKFCQERECQGCQIYYQHLLELEKVCEYPAKSLVSTNSLAVPIKASSFSPNPQSD